jgi:protein TonB
MNVRFIRELGSAIQNGPFRAALALSLLVHLALLLVFLHGGAEGEGDRVVKLMRVRILQAPSAPAPPPPAPPAVRPKPEPPALEQAIPPPPPPVAPRAEAAPAPLETAALPPATPPPPTPVPSLEQSTPPAPMRSPVEPEREEPREAPAAGTPTQTAAFEVEPHPSSAPAPGPSAPVEPSGAGRIVAVAAMPASGNGTTSQALEDGSAQGTGGAAGAAGHLASGTAGASPAGNGSAAGVDSSGAPGKAGPGPADLAAVRRRIEARKIYPRIAVRNGWQGRVLVEMHLEGDGRLAAVRLLEGSGYAVLDEATITAVRSASPYPPVARVLTVPIEYRLVP